MKKRGFQKHVAVLMGAMLMTASLAACGGGNKSGGKQDSGEPKLGTEQTEFSILGGQSALSPAMQTTRS